jgi:hypothetical protein
MLFRHRSSGLTRRVPTAAGWIGLCIGLAGCASLPDEQPPAALADQALHSALLGDWCNPTPQGGCWAHDRFEADGRFASCGQAEGDARPFHGSGRFHIAGRRMCYQVTQASANFWLPPGGRYCTEILSIGPLVHRYRDLDSGAVFSLQRQPPPGPACLAGP